MFGQGNLDPALLEANEPYVALKRGLELEVALRRGERNDVFEPGEHRRIRRHWLRFRDRLLLAPGRHRDGGRPHRSRWLPLAHRRPVVAGR
jgi:hypothetical protein